MPQILTERDYVRYCLKKVAEKARPEPVQTWTDGVFIELSERIEEETGILISRNTLKRLFDKMKTTEEYKPQKETRNALAVFIGYQSWAHFRDTVPAETVVEELRLEANPEPVSGSKRPKKYPFRWVASASLLLVALFALGLIFWKGKSSARETFSAQLTIENPRDTIPYDLKCRIQYSPSTPDSIQIGEEYLGNGPNSFSLGITQPGFHWLILRRAGKILDAAPYHALSKGWVGYVNPKNKKTYYPLSHQELCEGGQARVHPAFFYGKSLDSLAFYFWLKNARKFASSLDHLTFEIRFFVPGSDLVCKGANIKLVGDSAQLEASLYPEGCSNHAYIFLPGRYYQGKYEDFHNSYFPRNTWTTVRIENKNKNTAIFIDRKKVFSGRHDKSGGELRALSLRFHNFCRVDYIRIWDKEGKLIEQEEF